MSKLDEKPLDGLLWIVVGGGGVLILLGLYFFFWTTLSLPVIFLVILKLKKLWELYQCRKIASKVPEGFKVIIIGCGFSGIHSGIECKKRGIPFVIYEKKDNLGGTWYNNQYPGCHCDVPSYLYSFSFEHYIWSTPYANDTVLRKYLVHCVQKYGISNHIQYNTEVKSLVWDDKQKHWIVKTSQGTEIASVIIDATGILHVPRMPKFEGQENYKGQMYHSTEMNPKVKWDGLKVSIIGSAASAIQMVPQIAKTAKVLNVFQRSPNWVIPSWNTEYGNPLKFLVEKVSIFSYLYRVLLYIRGEFLFYMIFKKNSKAREQLEDNIKTVIRSEFDPAMCEKLIPNYPFGCKRLLISHNYDYLKALKLPHVNLITEKIQCITETGVQTNEGHYESDMIIFATGFDPIIKKFQIIGKDKVELKGPGVTYWGVTYPDFPNFFMVLGPNTSLGHTSVVWMAECQVNYIMQCISFMIDKSFNELSVKSEKSDKWFKDYIHNRFDDKVWSGSCSSWYKDENGKIWTLWPDHTFAYWWGTTLAAWKIPRDYFCL